MYYRRKLLLALLEICDGSLAESDCRRLLEAFCQRRGKNYYDFFFSQGRSWSFLLTQDKDYLIGQGLLAASHRFQLQQHSDGYTEQLKVKDRSTLLACVAEISKIRQQDRYFLPLARHEISPLVSVSPGSPDLHYNGNGQTGRSPGQHLQSDCLFTLGYEGLSLDAYLNILLSHHIEVLIDVRKNAISRKYGFSKTQLSTAVRMVGIDYLHLPDLGIPSDLRRGLTEPSAYQQLFEYYATHILPEQTTAVEQLEKLLADRKRVALTCFEADYHSCHRYKIVEHLQGRSHRTPLVIHLNGSSAQSIANMQANTEELPYGHRKENTVYSSI
ncbi:MAG: DUF488 domain-containing protein [Ktedonobacteraceae bacterium]|nr:DUF488 domain-containing protein [Ktedonobacteraceae bacterium]